MTAAFDEFQLWQIFRDDKSKTSHFHQPFLADNTSLLPHFPWGPTPDSEDQRYELPHAGHKDDPTYFPDMVSYLDKTADKIMDAIDDPRVFTRTNGTQIPLENGKLNLAFCIGGIR